MITMELTAIASWLNETFYTLDTTVLSALHNAAEQAGGILTPIMNVFSITSKEGIGLVVLSLVLMLFARTRKMGLCMFGAVCCGAIITNIILKNIVQRPRPFETLPEVMAWLQYLGAQVADGSSFPSGHTTAAMAAMTALFLNSKRKNVAWIGFLYVAGVAVSRNYLMAHYPSDVLFALLIGLVAALIAYPIANAIFALLKKNENRPLARFLLHADICGYRGKHAKA